MVALDILHEYDILQLLLTTPTDADVIKGRKKALKSVDIVKARFCPRYFKRNRKDKLMS